MQNKHIFLEFYPLCILGFSNEWVNEWKVFQLSTRHNSAGTKVFKFLILPFSLSPSHTHTNTHVQRHTLFHAYKDTNTLSLSPFSKPRISIFTSRERVRTFQRSFDPEVKRLDPGWQFRNLIRIRRFPQKLLLRASLRVHQPVDGYASLLALFTACLKLFF